MRNPLHTAGAGLFFGALALLSACEGTVVSGGPLCEAPATPISAIQGAGDASSLTGQKALVRGVVTFRDAGGLYIESIAPDQDPATAEALFLQAPPGTGDLRPGWLVAALGTVAELGEGRDTQTALVALEEFSACDRGLELPLTTARLPADREKREALESMRITLESRSVVTDVYRLNRGEFVVAAESLLPAPTEVAWPGRDARRQAALNREAALRVRLPAGNPPAFPLGTELLSDTGVLGQDEHGPVLLLTDGLSLSQPRLNPPPARPPGALRVVSLNLWNYFNGDGAGNGFPTPRGAETSAAFERQRAGFRAALERMNPDLVAVMEIENDGFGPRSAAADFVADLERATGGRWRAAQASSGRVGTDEITVGLFHRDTRLEAMGGPLLLDAAPFDLLNRTPMAQVYRDRVTGVPFLAVVNHFKSKTGCPEQGRDRDQRDGQGCWNPTRLAAAQALAPWVLHLASERAEGRALVLGDLNAYRMEDPVRHLLDQGFVDLTGGAGNGHEYSYVFRGASGTLDHALATPALAADVVRAQILNINAAWPPRMELEPAWVRSSDHDPVLVDLLPSQSDTAD